MKKATIPKQLILSILAMTGMLLILLMGCGPSAQYHEEQARLQQAQEEEATPAPCSRTEGTYPELDETLAALVRAYERCEKTEREAAAQAPDSYRNTVLVEAIPDANVKAIDKWMESQGIQPRHTTTRYNPNRVYAFVRVSLLGDLSQRQEVTAVQLPDDRGDRDSAVKYPAPTNTAVIPNMRSRGSRALSTDAEGAELPWWLHGYTHPRSYPKMQGAPRLIASAYENGYWDDIKDSLGYYCLQNHEDGSRDVFVAIDFLVEGNNEAVIVQWLVDAGLDRDGLTIHDDILGHNKFLVVYLPIPKIIELSTLPEVEKLSGDSCGMGETSSLPIPRPVPDAGSGGAPQQGVVDTQGRALHMADDWHDNDPAYEGQNVKIGIIDTNFNGIGELLGSELPENNEVHTKVHGYCWTMSTDEAPRPNLATCNRWGSGHGTNVAEIVADMAPQAELYVSNVISTMEPRIRRQRFWQSVDHMVRNGVSIINHSYDWGFREGLGRGENPGHTLSANMTVEDSANGLTLNNIDYDGIMWSVAAGNNAPRNWYGAFNPDSSREKYHQWSTPTTTTTSTDQIYLNDLNGGRYNPANAFQEILVEARWDDSWFRADCDFELKAYEERTNGTNDRDLMFEDKPQGGGASDQPFESHLISLTPNRNYYFKLRAVACAAANLPSWIQLRVGTSGASNAVLSHQVLHTSIGIPADHKNGALLATAAANSTATDSLLPESSIGPTLDGRLKPDITAVSCVNTQTNSGSTCGFGGTSAAAPHIAGMAALVKGRFNHLDGEQLAFYLKKNALSKTDRNLWGAGLAQLPNPANNPSLAGVPAYIEEGRQVRIQAKSPQTSRTVALDANRANDDGKIYFGACSDRGETATANNNAFVTLSGCVEGNAQLLVYQNSKLYNIHNIEVTESCAESISLTSETKTFRGSWRDTCPAVANTTAGSLAGYHIFSLNSRKQVSLSLSSTVTPALYLHDGGDRDAAVFPGGGGRVVSRTLPAGTYVIEATTQGRGFDGTSYTLTASAVDPTPITGFSPSQSINAPEDLRIGSTVGTLQASSPQGGIVFAILSGNTNDTFSISQVLSRNNEESGNQEERQSPIQATANITLARALNRGDQSSYNLRIRARDRGNNDAFSTVTITVTEPALPQVPVPGNVHIEGSTSTSIEVDWTAPSGASKYRVQYRSGSSGTWRTATSIVTASRFTVSGLSCGRSYQFQVTAYGNGTTHLAEWGSPSGAVRGSTSVCPHPVFTGEPYRYEVNETAAIGSVVGTVTATDPTPGDVLTYSIRSGNTGEAFAINGSTGAITVAATLDHGINSSYRLGVRVTDLLRHTDNTTVTITVLENVAPAPETLAVQATGRNSVTLEWTGVTDTTRYRVQYREASASQWSTSSDQVTTAQHEVTGLTCETAYEFRVQGYGDGTNYSAKWGIATEALEASAGDCEEPEFSEERYNFTVLDTAAAGTVVATLVAMDPTVNEVLTYTIDNQDPSGFFTIDSATGVLSLARAVSEGDGHFFTLGVRVTDLLGTSDTARLIITPRANPAPAPDNLVAAETDRTTISIRWDSVPNSARYLVNYRDQGTDTWFSDGSSELQTATAYTLTGLSCDSSHEFQVSARGDGVIYSDSWGTAAGPLSVTTGDCEEPVFDQEAYSAEVLTTAAAEDLVVTVSAADPTENETLAYSITSGNRGSRFSIGSNGEVKVARALGSPAAYTLALEVRDGDGQTDTTVLTVNVLQPVVVSFQQTAVSVTEGTTHASITVRLDTRPRREVVIPITATAGDGMTGEDYSGLPQEVTFTASQTSRTVRLTIVDDSEDEPAETLTLGFGELAFGSSAGSSSQVVLTIEDNDPTVVTLLETTMTVGNYGGYRGYIRNATHGNPNGSMTDDDFQWQGTTYAFEDLLSQLNTSRLTFYLSARMSVTAREGLVLVLDTLRLPFSESTAAAPGQSFSWNLSQSPGWSNNQEVTVKVLHETP